MDCRGVCALSPQDQLGSLSVCRSRAERLRCISGSELRSRLCQHEPTPPTLIRRVRARSVKAAKSASRCASSATSRGSLRQPASKSCTSSCREAITRPGSKARGPTSGQHRPGLRSPLIARRNHVHERIDLAGHSDQNAVPRGTASARLSWVCQPREHVSAGARSVPRAYPHHRCGHRHGARHCAGPASCV